MITTSENWKEYSKDHTIYHIKAVLTSTDGTVLNLTDEDFMMGSVRIRDACSSTSSFDIGSVITNEFECSFNNTSGKFDGFDFRLATIEVQFGIVYEDESEEWIDRGVYTLDNPSSLGYTIQANAYDNMDKLNRIYIGKTLTDGVFVDITFPISSSDMAEALCNYCGVTFGSWMLDNDIELNEFEYNESTTCREVLAWVLQINCGFGRMNPQGALECKWYNSDGYMEFDSLDGGIMSPWGSAEDADGGTMQPWSIVADINGGLGLNYLVNRVARTTVASEDIKITGIRVYVPDTVEEFEFATVGTNGYILVIENNPFVTADNMNGIANAIYSVIGGTRFRPFDASIWGDPSIEAGDTIGIYDYLGRLYISYISNLSYPLNGLMDIECGAETVSDRENEYSNPQTSTIQGAVTAAYDYIAAKKISADYITAGTIEADVVATNFTMEGGKINITTEGKDDNKIELQWQGSLLSRNNIFMPTGMKCLGAYPNANQSEEANFFCNGSTIENTVGSNVYFAQFVANGMLTKANDSVTIDLSGASGTGMFSSSVTAASFINSSRLDLKQNLTKIGSVLDKIKSADILSFNFKDEADDKKHIGLAIGGDYNVPEEVISVDEEGKEQGVDLYSMVSMAWKAIQEQQEIIESLEARVEALEKKLNPVGKITDIIKGDTDGNTN